MELASSQSLVESSVNGSSFLSKVCTRKQQRRKLDDAPPVAQPSACKCDARTPADYLHRFGKSNGRKFKLVAILILFALVGKAVPALAVAAPESPKVQGHGERLKGGPFQFSCEASSGSHKYTWLKDGVMLSEHTERTLNISSLSEGDSGLYQCSYRCGNRACMSEPFNLVVQVFEHLTLEPKVMEVEDGQAVLMRCIVNSSTPATLTLYVSSERTTVKYTNSHSFDVRIPPGQDWIILQCQASLPGSSGTLNGYARLYKKGIKVRLKRPDLLPNRDPPVLGRAFQLKCQLPSLPFLGVNVNISFTLYQNGIVVKSQQPSPAFEFSSLSKEDDGLYNCTATVGPPETVSNRSKGYQLRAFVPPVIHLKPEATDGFITRTAGDKLNLTCQVTEAYPGVGANNYTWTRHSITESLPQPLPETTDTLMLEPLTRGKAGVYWCHAWNDPALPPGNASIAVMVTPEDPFITIMKILYALVIACFIILLALFYVPRVVRLYRWRWAKKKNSPDHGGVESVELSVLNC